MFCPQCGESNPDNAVTCAKCGASLGNPYQPGKAIPRAPQRQVPNYLVPSIFVTLCCCPPFGIPAIIYASQVNTKLGAGDYEGAEQSSRQAKMWMLIGLISGLVVLVLYWGLVFAAGMLGVQQQQQFQQFPR